MTKENKKVMVRQGKTNNKPVVAKEHPYRVCPDCYDRVLLVMTYPIYDLETGIIIKRVCSSCLQLHKDEGYLQ